MTVKIMGAIFVIAACGGMGFGKAAACKREERLLQKLILTLEFMESELEFRMLSLPELCRMAAGYAGGLLGNLFLTLARELDRQVFADAQSCMRAALAESCLPNSLRKHLSLLGKTLGRFHLSGQLTGLQSVKAICRQDLERLCARHAQQLRSYQTLGICAGVALVIMFI